MNNNIFIFLLLIQGFTFCADASEINLLENRTQEEILLLFQYAQVEEYDKKTNNYFPRKFHIPKKEFKTIQQKISHYFFDDHYKLNDHQILSDIFKIIFPIFYVFSKEIYNKYHHETISYATISNLDEENKIIKINEQFDLYRLYAGYSGSVAYHEQLFLYDKNTNMLTKIKINDIYPYNMISSYSKKKAYTEFKLEENVLTFNSLIHFNYYYYATDNMEKTFRLTLPTDTPKEELITKHLNQENNRKIAFTNKIIIFCTILYLFHKSKNHSFWSPLFLPKLLSELYYQQSWGAMLKEWLDSIKKEDIKKSEYDSLQNLLKLAQEKDDPELMKKYHEYKKEFDKKYEQ